MDDNNWNFEETRQSDFSNSEIAGFIKPYYPSVKEEKLNLLHHGSFNVYEIDGFIFRIPDKTLFNKKGFDLIQRETKKLSFLKNKLKLKIPEPLFVSKSPELPIVGYNKIPGSSIEKIWDKIPANKKNSIAREIGIFLKQFHSQDLAEKFIREFKPNISSYLDIKDIYENIFNKTRELIYPLLKKELIDKIEQLFINYFNELNSKKFTVCLTHQDFDTSNILIDEETFEIIGIIDFEETDIGDPAYDLIFWNQGITFQESLLKTYNEKTDPYLEARILFYYKRSGIPYMLYGIENNLPDMITYGKFLLEKRIK